MWENLSGCGWMGEKTEVEVNIPFMSTAYLYWWPSSPREIVEKFRAKLQRMLLEANGNELGTMHPAARGLRRRSHRALGLLHGLLKLSLQPVGHARQSFCYFARKLDVLESALD